MFQPGIELHNCGLIIDSLLGTGIKGSIREPYLSAIEFINALNVHVISVDVPSGMCADTGEVIETAVKADLTVTMGIVKSGLVTAIAKKFVGEIHIADIGLPRILIP